MISLSHLNKLKEITIFFTVLILNSAFAADPVDIWEKKKKQKENEKGKEKDGEKREKEKRIKGERRKMKRLRKVENFKRSVIFY